MCYNTIHQSLPAASRFILGSASTHLVAVCHRGRSQASQRHVLLRARFNISCPHGTIGLKCKPRYWLSPQGVLLEAIKGGCRQTNQPQCGSLTLDCLPTYHGGRAATRGSAVAPWPTGGLPMLPGCYRVQCPLFSRALRGFPRVRLAGQTGQSAPS